MRQSTRAQIKRCVLMDPFPLQFSQAIENIRMTKVPSGGYRTHYSYPPSAWQSHCSLTQAGIV